MIRLLPRVALQLWIVLFIVFFGAEVIHLEPSLRVVTQVVYGIPLVAWAAFRLRGPADRLDWAVLGLLAVYAFVCVLSRDRTESLGTLGLATAYAAWFLVMRREVALRGPTVLAIATGLGLTLAFNTYLAIQEKVERYATLGAAPLEGMVTFPWETVNALPMLVLLAVPFVAWLGAGPIRWLLAAVVLASAVVLLPVSNGRAGYLGLTVTALGFLVLLPATWRRWSAFGQKPRLAAGVAGIAAILVGVVVVLPRVVDGLVTSGRLHIWEQGLNMIAGAPLVGHGPGVYSWARLEFAPSAADLLAVRLPHDVPLLTLAEGGIILAAGFVGAAVAWMRTAWGERSAWTTPERLTVAALSGFATSSVLDDFSFLPALIAMVLTLAALLVPTRRGAGGRFAWLMPALLGIAALVSLPSVIGVDVARASAQAGRTAMVDGAYANALESFAVATSAHPELGGYWLSLGMAAAYAGDEERAVAAYERAVEVAPGDPRGYAALAHLGAGDDIALLEAAAERTLDDPQDAARLGVALAADGRQHDALHAWSAAVALRPEIIRLLPYDKTGISMTAVADEALITIANEPRPAPHENDAARWDIGLAIDDLPDDAGVAWRAVDAARRGDLAGARALADQVVRDDPTSARGYQARAAVAVFACDAAEERDALRLERHASGAWVEPDPEPRALRDFVYREASLGPSQPPGARLDLRVERWPWALVDRPECD